MTKTNQTLTQISVKIKALEKKSIQNVVVIGKLLEEASQPEACKHGEYMKWLKREFAWSHQTASNYRDIYALSQNPNILDFDKLDISISALYLIKGYILYPERPRDNQHAQYVAGMAVIEAARKRRVSLRVAREMLDRLAPEPEPDEDESEPDDRPEPKPEDEEPAPDNDADDEPKPELDDDDEEPEPKPKSKRKPKTKPKPDDDDETDDESSDNDTDDKPEDDGADDEPDDENEDADVPNEREIAGVFEMLDATLWGRPKNFDWQKVIEIVSAEKIYLIITGLTKILDQYKASEPPEPTKRVKRKQKEKESMH